MPTRTIGLPLHPETPFASSAATVQGGKPQKAGSNVNFPASPPRLRLQLVSGIVLDLKDQPSNLIGRASGPDKPDLDLTRYGGVEQGVSRQHAMILLQDGRYYIQDLGGINNTLLNGSRLHPHQMYPLAHGDQVKFGELVVRVLLSAQPSPRA